MTDAAVPTNANEFIEQQLNLRLAALEEAFAADALCVAGPLFGPLDDLIRVMVEDRRKRDGSRGRLVVLLTTDGGLIETVQRIAETFRHHYGHVSFVVPNYAFSAGTVLVMSGDDIHMDYYSRLGPIDPQVEAAPDRWVPALGYLAQWQRLLDKADAGTLTPIEFRLMVVAFDQAELYKYEQARDLSVALLEEWLTKYKFKDWEEKATSKEPVTPKVRADRAKEIGLALNDTERWHSHSHGISMAILRNEINLKIDDLADDPDRHEKVKQYDGLLADYMRKMGVGGMLHIVGRFRPLLTD